MKSFSLFNLPEHSRQNAIIYYNGSFDPAHKGHRSALEAAMEKTQAVGAVVVVCDGENSNKPNRSSWEVRRQIALEVFSGSNKIVVSPWAKEQTKEYLLQRAHVINLIGSDVWENYSKRTVTDFHGVCVSLRNGENADYKTNLIGKEIFYVTPEVQGCSSSEIRNYLKIHPELYEGVCKEPDSILNKLPSKALDYIIKNKLFSKK